jgi:acetyl esterase/lipase
MSRPISATTTSATRLPTPGMVSSRATVSPDSPPLLIQAGSHEVLLDDATRLAVKAAADDVAVVLDITPGVPPG